MQFWIPRGGATLIGALLVLLGVATVIGWV
ncbi:MAG: hypothetical protein ACI89X_001652 [Planctomycetota bacterium]